MSTIFTQAAEATTAAAAAAAETVVSAATAATEAAAPVAAEAAAAASGAMAKATEAVKHGLGFVGKSPVRTAGILGATAVVVAGAYVGYKWYKARKAGAEKSGE